MFGKWQSKEQIKAAKIKKKERKNLIFELQQNSIVHKLREDLELSKSRADHFEREFFDLKKSHEVLNDCYRTIADADQQLKAELYELTKEMREANEKNIKLIELVSKQDIEITRLLIPMSSEKPSSEPVQDLHELTTKEVNDQVNEFLKSK
jgi:hypothetical protein